jgi:hypothetical protein
VDSVGNIFVVDSGSSSIRKISPDGVVTTIGNVPEGFFYFPQGIAIGANGCLIVSDSGNNRIAKSSVPSGQTGSTLRFNNWKMDLLFKSIWGPGSNAIDLSGGGGLNYSTSQGVGWSQEISGIYVTSFSLISSGGWVNGSWVWEPDPETGSWRPINGDNSYQYLAAIGKTSKIQLSVPKDAILEVWNLNTMTVVSSNVNQPGANIIFDAQPFTKYGGFAWYINNQQADLAIYANYLVANPPSPISIPSPTPTPAPSGGGGGSQ